MIWKFLGNWTQTSMGNKDSPLRNHIQTQEQKGSPESPAMQEDSLLSWELPGILWHHYIQLKAMKQMKQWTISHQLLHPDFSGWGNWEQRPPSPSCLKYSLSWLTWNQWRECTETVMRKVRAVRSSPQWKRTGKHCEWRSEAVLECPLNVCAKPASEIIWVRLLGQKHSSLMPVRRDFLRACPIH